MKPIESIEALEALYSDASPLSITKVADHLTPLYRRWIEASRFVIVSTVGPGGTDGTPRGDDGPVVRVADSKTLHLPDWSGNNRLDTLRNIVTDGRISLMFMVPGCDNVVRINGKAMLTADEGLTASFEKDGKRPRTVAVISTDEVYFQCAKALMRAKLWQAGDESAGLPTAGQFLKEAKNDFEAEPYDAGYAENAKAKMW